jgi:hypothetical protein
MTLAKTIEHALWPALQTHVQSKYGTVAEVIPATGPGQPVCVRGYFFLENVCKDVATAVERHLAAAAATKEPS